MMECKFDVLSLNTAGIGDSFKRRKVFNYLKKNCSSKGVTFLQETHSVKKNEELRNNQWGCGKSSMFFAHGTSNSPGTLIAFREGLNYKVLSSHLNGNSGYVILKVEIQSSPFILINYYAPNEEGQQVLILTEIRDILQKIELEKDTQLIWGGDFNCFFDCKLDADGGNPKLKVQSIAKLVSMMSENDLCDIFRVRNPDMKRYTWRRKTPFKQRGLDYFLISDQLQDQIDQVDIIPSIQSDHSTLKLKICGAKCSSKGPSYWKLNNSLLQDKVFTELMKSEIPKFYQESEELRNPMMRWEYLTFQNNTQ